MGRGEPWLLHVLLVSVALGSHRLDTGRPLVAWTAAMALMGALLTEPFGGSGAGTVPGVVYGTVVFAGWMAGSLLLLLLLDPRRRKVLP